MKFRLSLFACFALMALPQAVQAACSHNGISYSVGATICSGGWLQECTPAGYWKAIGQCRGDDEAAMPTAPATSAAQAWLTKGNLNGPAGDSTPSSE